MPTAIGTNSVTSIARHYILPEVADNAYNSNPVMFRLNKGNKKVVNGGTQIEAPAMYAKMAAGGWYSGFELLDTSPSDTIKNLVWDWKQSYVPVTIDGLTFIKTDSPDAIANFVRLQFEQATMEMADILGTGIWSAGTNAKMIDGLGIAVDSTGTYGGLSRSTNTWLASDEDSSTTTLTLTALQTRFGTASRGGRHPTLIASRQEQYNRFIALNHTNQRFPVQPMGADEQLAAAGFSNALFNGTPWVVDSHVPDGPNSSNSAIFLLNEDFFWLAVSPKSDFYMTEFQESINQNAMTARVEWTGNLICTNSARQSKMTALTA